MDIRCHKGSLMLFILFCSLLNGIFAFLCLLASKAVEKTRETRELQITVGALYRLLASRRLDASVIPKWLNQTLQLTETFETLAYFVEKMFLQVVLGRGPRLVEKGQAGVEKHAHHPTDEVGFAQDSPAVVDDGRDVRLIVAFVEQHFSQLLQVVFEGGHRVKQSFVEAVVVLGCGKGSDKCKLVSYFGQDFLGGLGWRGSRIELLDLVDE